MRVRLRTANQASIWVLKVIFVYPFCIIRWGVRLIIKMFNHNDKRLPKDVPKVVPKREEKVEVISLPKDDIPEFEEIINVDRNTIIGIEQIKRVPDETAFIRIVGEENFSKQFKRRVFQEVGYQKQKYIKVDNKKYYIEKAKARID